MKTEQLETFADLLLTAGVNIQEGQNLFIRAETIHWPFVNILEKAAYEKGVRHIKTDMENPVSTLHRLTAQKEACLDYVPAYEAAFAESVRSEHWSMITLYSMADPDLFEKVDPKRNALYQKAQRQKLAPLLKAFHSGRQSWTASTFPTPKWAAKILGGAPDAANEARLWEIFVPIFKLDQPDPAAAWLEHGRLLKRRADTLNRLALTRLHFEGPQTDLKVSLTPHSIWLGGLSASEKNGVFIANLPTEEVFTVPDFRKTQGRAAITKPLKVMNQTVTGAWLDFKDGKVTAYGAQTGKKALDAFFKTDPQACFLGEVALVDGSSPLSQSGRFFDSILLDENAASHIALGFGYLPAFKGGNAMTPKELLEKGCNQSLVHVDFMVGAPAMQVTGITQGGETVPVVKNGLFAI